MKRILVALDGSPRARGVLTAAAQLAELTSARLILFRAVGLPPDLPRELLHVAPGDIESVMRESARTELAALAADIPAERIEAIETDLAVPWDGIVAAGRRTNADLIVLGSHGYHGLDRLLGTTAAKVVNHADRNVLVVRNAKG